MKFNKTLMTGKLWKNDSLTLSNEEWSRGDPSGFNWEYFQKHTKRYGEVLRENRF